MFHQAVAESLGLSVTEFKCLDITSRIGPVTAGQLAEYTGLSTGAITGLVDRLEQAGFVKRQSDPKDRRKVLIQAVSMRGAEVGKLFESLARSMGALISTYPPDQAELILDFMRSAVEVMRGETQKLRAVMLKSGQLSR